MPTFFTHHKVNCNIQFVRSAVCLFSHLFTCFVENTGVDSILLAIPSIVYACTVCEHLLAWNSRSQVSLPFHTGFFEEVCGASCMSMRLYKFQVFWGGNWGWGGKIPGPPTLCMKPWSYILLLFTYNPRSEMSSCILKQPHGIIALFLLFTNNPQKCSIKLFLYLAYFCMVIGQIPIYTYMEKHVFRTLARRIQREPPH